MISPLPYEICGYVGGVPMYRIPIRVKRWHRLVQLSQEGVEGLPDWLDWGNHNVEGWKIIATTDPEHFNEEATNGTDTHTRRDQTGLSQLQGSD